MSQPEAIERPYAVCRCRGRNWWYNFRMPSLAEYAREFNLDLSSGQLDAFETYYRELAAWNERVNLTAIVERDAVIVKHFLDSLSVAPLVAPTAALIDIGAGAGLPGIPLKIALPGLRLTLVDATRKKVDFLKHVITTLALRETRALQARAEDLGRNPAYREQFDAAVARAVADLPVLAEYALPLVRVGGSFIAQKGIDVAEEVRRGQPAIARLGGRVREIRVVTLPGLEPRHLVVVEKTSPTPSGYPRSAGIPERKPIVKGM